MKKILYFTLILLICLLGILIYSRFLGTSGLKTNEIILNTNIPDSYDGLKIIHFADLHYKKVITEQRVKNMVTEINKNKPDLVLFTGDLLDRDYKVTNTDINFLIQELSKIQSTYGNYAILGDCDIDETETIKNIYIQSNFTLLENNYSIIHNEKNDKLFIAGINSFQENKSDLTPITDYLSTNVENNYKIILIHEPDYIPTILENIPDTSLILAAHSINGSINIPFIKQLLLPNGSKKYYKPYYKIDQTDIYITNGIGVNEINFRLFNTPSINFYRIKKVTNN